MWCGLALGFCFCIGFLTSLLQLLWDTLNWYMSCVT